MNQVDIVATSVGPHHRRLPRTRCDQACISILWETQETEQAYEDYYRAGRVADPTRPRHILEIRLRLYDYASIYVPAPWLTMLALVFPGSRGVTFTSLLPTPNFTGVGELRFFMAT